MLGRAGADLGGVELAAGRHADLHLLLGAVAASSVHGGSPCQGTIASCSSYRRYELR